MAKIAIKCCQITKISILLCQTDANQRYWQQVSDQMVEILLFLCMF